MIRTIVDIDSELLAEAMALFPTMSAVEVVEEALRWIIRCERALASWPPAGQPHAD